MNFPVFVFFYMSFLIIALYRYHYNYILYYDIMYVDDEESFRIRGSKVLCPSLFDNTVVHISLTIVNQVYERSELMSKAKLIIHLVSIHIIYTLYNNYYNYLPNIMLYH